MLYFNIYSKNRDTESLPLALFQMTSVGKNLHHNKQPHHMETQCCRCRDRNPGFPEATKINLRWILPAPRWWCYLNGCDREGGWCMRLARHAPFTGGSHGKSLWASFPPRVSVYLHNPQVTLHRPARQTNPSQTERGLPGNTARPKVHSVILLEGSLPYLPSLWFDPPRWRKHLKNLIHSSSPLNIMLELLMSECLYKVFVSHQSISSNTFKYKLLQAQWDIIPYRQDLE